MSSRLPDKFAPPLDNDEEYHVFIFHSEEDNGKDVARGLHKKLEEHDFKCFRSKYFEGGKYIPESILSITEKSRRVVTVVSRAMLQEEWAIFEIANSRSKSREKGEVIFIPILCDVDPTLVPSYFMEIYSLRDTDKNFWIKLFHALTEPKSLKTVEVGNIAHGIAWSYYYGYLALKLPGIVQRIRNSEFARDTQIPMLSKMVIIIPESGKCPRNIGSKDKNITRCEGVIECFANRAGKPRPYHSSVYKVKDPDTNQEYYVVMEYASVLMVLPEMEFGRTSQLTASERKRQIQLFSKKMTEITQHKNASFEHDNPAIFIDYKDDQTEPELLSRVVARRVSSELEKVEQDLDDVRMKRDVPAQVLYSHPPAAVTEHIYALDGIPDNIKQTSSIRPSYGSNQQYTCYISSHPDDDSFVKELVKKLESLPNCRCFLSSRDVMGNEPIFGHMDKCRKVIMVITKSYLDPNSRQLWEHIQALVKSYDNKDQQKVTIPVLHGVQPNEVPSYMKEVNYLTTTDSLFWEKFVNMIAAENPAPWASIEITDIAEGLAWSYWYRYLKFCVLPGFKDRLTNSKYSKDPQRRLLTKFIILMPKSGYCAYKVPDLDSNISEEEILSCKVTVAGIKDRDYSNTVFRIKDPDGDEEFYVVMEYATPIWTIYEMEQGLIAGLRPEDKEKQLLEFNRILKEILEHEVQSDCRDLFVTLEYDDQSTEEHHFSRQIINLVRSQL